MTEKKSGGFMRMLANIGLAEEIPDPVTPENHHPAGPAATGQRPYATVVKPKPASSAPSPSTATADPKTLEKLEARLQKNCPPAYTSFMEQYENLREVIPDEVMRFKAALKASHTTSEQLVDAIDHLIATMDTARSDFQHTFDESRQAKIGSAEATLHATEEQIASYEKQLQTVQETIASLRTKLETDRQAIAAEQAKIESVRVNFEAAHAQVVGHLNAQKSRVQTMPRV